MRPLLTICVCSLLLASCHKEEPPDPVKEYPVKGEVISVDPLHHTAKIKSEKIEGWMEAMTMEYPVKVNTDMQRLKPGVRFHATVYQHQRSLEYWIGKVALEPGDSSAPATGKPESPERTP